MGEGSSNRTSLADGPLAENLSSGCMQTSGINHEIRCHRHPCSVKETVRGGTTFTNFARRSRTARPKPKARHPRKKAGLAKVQFLARLLAGFGLKIGKIRTATSTRQATDHLMANTTAILTKLTPVGRFAQSGHADKPTGPSQRNGPERNKQHPTAPRREFMEADADCPRASEDRRSDRRDRPDPKRR